MLKEEVETAASQTGMAATERDRKLCELMRRADRKRRMT